MRMLAYLWALPTTIVGVLLALPVLLAGGRWHRVDGVLEVHGSLLEWALRRWVPIAGASTSPSASGGDRCSCPPTWWRA
jgi:hypothetical protein